MADGLVAAPIQIFGSTGKTVVRVMIDHVLAAAADNVTLPGTVIVLSPGGTADPAAWTEQAFPAPALAVVSADHQQLVDAVPAQVHTITFGYDGESEFRVSDVRTTLRDTQFTLHHAGQQHAVALAALGEQAVMPAAATIAVASEAGLTVDAGIAALAQLSDLGPGRMQVLTREPATIIADTSGATLESVAAALKALASITGLGRSVAVLGELATGEEDPREAHDRIGRLIVRLNVKKLIVIGTAARHIHNAAGLEGSWDGESILVDTAQQAYDLIREDLWPDDVVLVKASREASLEALALRLAGVRP